MITYQEESYDDCIAEICKLAPAHHSETEIDTDVVPLSPDFEVYGILSKSKMLRIITVRDNGVMVGYCSGIISRSHHESTTLVGTGDAYYIMPEYRKGFIAIKMFRKFEEMLKGLGVKKMVLSFKCDHDLSKLMQYLGLRAADITYAKLL